MPNINCSVCRMNKVHNNQKVKLFDTRNENTNQVVQPQLEISVEGLFFL